jgi:hypothetical protein
MAFRSERRFISKSDIRTGMMVWLQYQSKETGETKDYKALVIDPSRPDEHTGNIQLHGILLDEMHDVSIMELIIRMGKFYFDPDNRRDPLTELTSDEAYQKFREHYAGTLKDPFKSGKTIYRTFLVENIRKVAQVLIGLPYDASYTLKFSYYNSVVYGVVHHDHVMVKSDDFHILTNEIKNVKYQTYYEGEMHDNPTIQLLNLIDVNQYYKSKAKTWEPPHNPDLYLVTELFGGEGDYLWSQINDAIGERNLDTSNMTVIDVLTETSIRRPGSKDTSYWSGGSTKYKVDDITDLLQDSTIPSATSVFYKKFKDVTSDEFIKAHKKIFIEVFAGYEGRRGKEFVGSKMEAREKQITTYRQEHLLEMMKEHPGVYFAGLSHVEDFINKKGVIV